MTSEMKNDRPCEGDQVRLRSNPDGRIMQVKAAPLGGHQTKEDMQDGIYCTWKVNDKEMSEVISSVKLQILTYKHKPIPTHQPFTTRISAEGKGFIKPFNPLAYPDECIMCGSTENITKEHIFANWIKKYLKHESLFTLTDEMTKYGFVRSFEIGNHAERKIPVLCKPCNEIWGSDIQDAVSIILKPFIDGDWRALNSEEREKIATWATSFAMVYEFTKQEKWITTTAQVRKKFRFNQKNEPPPGWHIYMAPYEGEIGLLIRHAPMTYKDSENKVNTFLQMFTVGKISFIVFGTIHPELSNYYDTAACELFKFFKNNGMLSVGKIELPFPENKPPALTLQRLEEIYWAAPQVLDNVYSFISNR